MKRSMKMKSAIAAAIKKHVMRATHVYTQWPARHRDNLVTSSAATQTCKISVQSPVMILYGGGESFSISNIIPLLTDRGLFIKNSTTHDCSLHAPPFSLIVRTRERT